VTGDLDRAIEKLGSQCYPQLNEIPGTMASDAGTWYGDWLPSDRTVSCHLFLL
jgi:hypothetical protein